MTKKILALLLCVMLTGCTKEQTQSNEIHIPIVGTLAYFEADDSFIKGAKMAIEDANQGNSEYVFTTEVYDDEDNYEKGMTIIDSLTNEKNVPAIIGTQNFAILNSAAQSVKKAEKIMVMPHGSEENLRSSGNQFVFANTFSATEIGVGMGKYLADNNVSKIAVCYNDADISLDTVRGLASNKNLQIVDYVRGDITEAKFNLVYKRWESLGVSGVAIVHNTEEAFSLAKKIRTKNINMTIMGDYAFDIPYGITAMGDLANKIAMSFIFPVESSDKLETFKSRYKEKYGEECTLWAAHGYDSVKMITDTIVQNKTAKPAEIANKLRENGYDGITHNIKFDKNGAMTENKPFFQQVVNGKFQVVGEKYE